MKRSVRIAVEVESDSVCSAECHWWGEGFAGRGAVCTLFEKVLVVTTEEKRPRYTRTAECVHREEKLL